MSLIQLKVITPKQVEIETEVSSLTLSTTVGQMTLLPNHLPLVAPIQANLLYYYDQDKSCLKYEVSEGIIYFRDNIATVLVDKIVEFSN